jgi:hypothetical protein
VRAVEPVPVGLQPEIAALGLPGEGEVLRPVGVFGLLLDPDFLVDVPESARPPVEAPVDVSGPVHMRSGRVRRRGLARENGDAAGGGRQRVNNLAHTLPIASAPTGRKYGKE